MRIVAITFGSEGDWSPIVALCQGLTLAGHDTVLLAERTAAQYAIRHNVAFEPLAGDLAAETLAASTTMGRNDYSPAFVRLGTEMARRNMGEWMRALAERAKHADAIVFGGLGAYVGLSCAEALRIPAIGTALQPLRPTRVFPSPLLPPVRLPGWANRLTHQVVQAAMRRHFRVSHNLARRDILGLPPRTSDWQGYPVLFGMSPTVVPRPPDWPDRFSVVGYWWPQQVPAWQPDPALAAFLDAGEPPVYVGFGSMVMPEAPRFQASVVEALGSRRAVLSNGWGEWARASLPDTIRVIEATPHEWLFPRIAIAVHHGGAGTSHAVARAGVPSVVVPFAVDQFFWARRLQTLGVAAAPVTQRRMTARLLARALHDASDATMCATARRVASSIAHEPSVADTAKRIEELVATTGPPR